MNSEKERLLGILFVSLCVTAVCLVGYLFSSSSASLLTTLGLGMGMMLFFWIGYLFSPQYGSSHDTIQITLDQEKEGQK